LPYLAGYEFPLPFGLLAFASWVIPVPLGSSVALAVDLLENPDPIGVITFHMLEIRLERVPPLLRGWGVLELDSSDRIPYLDS
jgi:hypothetical protein